MPKKPIRGIHVLSLVTLFFFFACTMPDKPVSKEEAVQMAQRISRSIQHRNPVVMDDIFDVKTFTKRVAASTSRTLQKDIMAGAVEGLKQMKFGEQVLSSIGDKGSYQMVKQYEKDKKQHLLFRLYGGDGSVNYHDFELIKPAGEVKVADLLVYTSGENLSKTFGETLQMVQDKMPELSSGDLSIMQKMKSIKTLLAQKEYEQAKEAYQSMPRDFQRQKAFQLLHVQITSELGNEEYEKALDEYKNLFPGDPSMYLMGIDAYILQKNYAKALESVNKLDSLINKDPFLDYYRGLMYKLMEDSSQSRVCFERLYHNMPAFGGGIVELVVIYTKAGDIDHAASLLAKAEKDKSIDPAMAAEMYAARPDLKKAVDKDLGK